MDPADAFIEDFYDDFPAIEEEFLAALDDSLNPRGPDFLYDVIAGISLPAGATIIDSGCGEGNHARELARRFDARVIGVDPGRRNIEAAVASLREERALAGRTAFARGRIEALPLRERSADLILCREMLMHIVELEGAFAECRRVLRTDGRIVIYQVFSTSRMTHDDARAFWQSIDVAGAGWDPARVEAAYEAAGFRAIEVIDLSSESGEYQQEQSGGPGRRLLHMARLQRDPERYIQKFGRRAYDIMLADTHWHVYRMMGLLGTRVYVLEAPAA